MRVLILIAALLSLSVGPRAGEPQSLVLVGLKAVTGGPDGIAFDTPIESDVPEISGRSLGQVFRDASPLFSPIEGLPDALWNGQSCSGCHQWSREALCDQGMFYVQNSGSAARKEHPFGGAYKLALEGWAKGGCR